MSHYLSQLPSLTLNGVIDILLVAFLVYQALLVVRGTRAGHILLGLLVVGVLYLLAFTTGLEALRSVLSVIVPYVGFAVVVLFQSEIRRTLAGLVRRRWLTPAFRVGETAQEIAFALGELQTKKEGALIVLERDIGLRTFIESGVRIDGHLTRDLLVSIFYPQTALHDGAVIVQKDKIAAAACFLPLSTNPAISLKLGTRHRAAVGITEETDCLALVVSEETGTVSVATNGELVRGLSLPEVEERIGRHFGGTGKATAPAHIDEYAADMPFTQDASASALPTLPESQSTDEVKHP